MAIQYHGSTSTSKRTGRSFLASKAVYVLVPERAAVLCTKKYLALNSYQYWSIISSTDSFGADVGARASSRRRRPQRAGVVGSSSFSLIDYTKVAVRIHHSDPCCRPIDYTKVAVRIHHSDPCCRPGHVKSTRRLTSDWAAAAASIHALDATHRRRRQNRDNIQFS